MEGLLEEFEGLSQGKDDVFLSFMAIYSTVLSRRRRLRRAAIVENLEQIASPTVNSQSIECICCDLDEILPLQYIPDNESYGPYTAPEMLLWSDCTSPTWHGQLNRIVLPYPETLILDDIEVKAQLASSAGLEQALYPLHQRIRKIETSQLTQGRASEIAGRLKDVISHYKRFVTALQSLKTASERLVETQKESSGYGRVSVFCSDSEKAWRLPYSLVTKLLQEDILMLRKAHATTGSHRVSKAGSIFFKPADLEQEDTLRPTMELVYQSMARALFPHDELAAVSTLLILSKVPVVPRHNLQGSVRKHGRQVVKALLSMDHSHHDENGKEDKRDRESSRRQNQDTANKENDVTKALIRQRPEIQSAIRRSVRWYTRVVQMSKEVNGRLLNDLLESGDHDAISGRSLSANIVLQLLMIANDGKGDNYIVTAAGDLVGIDNDVILGPPFVRMARGEHMVELKSILFCDTQLMARAFDSSLATEICSQDPTLVLVSILKSLSSLSGRCKVLHKHRVLHHELSQALGLDVLLPAWYPTFFYDMFSKLQTVLGQPNMSHHDVLHALCPEIASYYQALRNACPITSEALSWLYCESSHHVRTSADMSTFERATGQTLPSKHSLSLARGPPPQHGHVTAGRGVAGLGSNLVLLLESMSAYIAENVGVTSAKGACRLINLLASAAPSSPRADLGSSMRTHVVLRKCLQEPLDNHVLSFFLPLLASHDHDGTCALQYLNDEGVAADTFAHNLVLMLPSFASVDAPDAHGMTACEDAAVRGQVDRIAQWLAHGSQGGAHMAIWRQFYHQAGSAHPSVLAQLARGRTSIAVCFAMQALEAAAHVSDDRDGVILETGQQLSTRAAADLHVFGLRLVVRTSAPVSDILMQEELAALLFGTPCLSQLALAQGTRKDDSVCVMLSFEHAEETQEALFTHVAHNITCMLLGVVLTCDGLPADTVLPSRAVRVLTTCTSELLELTHTWVQRLEKRRVQHRVLFDGLPLADVPCRPGVELHVEQVTWMLVRLAAVKKMISSSKHQPTLSDIRHCLDDVTPYPWQPSAHVSSAWEVLDGYRHSPLQALEFVTTLQHVHEAAHGGQGGGVGMMGRRSSTHVISSTVDHANHVLAALLPHAASQKETRELMHMFSNMRLQHLYITGNSFFTQDDLNYVMHRSLKSFILSDCHQEMALHVVLQRLARSSQLHVLVLASLPRARLEGNRTLDRLVPRSVTCFKAEWLACMHAEIPQ